MKRALLNALFAASMATAAPSAASEQDTELQTKIALCEAGIAGSCFDAAIIYGDREDIEAPIETLKFAKLACDKGRQNACKYQALTAHLAGNAINRRIVSTLIDGDPKGEWKYKSDLNAAIDRAKAYYQQSQSLDPSLSDDWPTLYAKLEAHRQD